MLSKMHLMLLFKLIEETTPCNIYFATTEVQKIPLTVLSDAKDMI